jgi:zinc finger protein
MEMEKNAPNVLAKQPCPMCKTDNLTLTEGEVEIPFFGLCYIFSMSCSECKYHQADVEAAEQKEPCRYTIEVSAEEDMKIRVVKSSEATVKIPHVATLESGPGSNGFVTNIEGLLNRIKSSIETARDMEEDDEIKKKSKNLLKRLQRVMWGQEKLKIIIEDPTGNSAIISEKAERSSLKK